MNCPKCGSEPERIRLILGDCISEMRKMEASSIDAIIADLPYEVTSNEKDRMLDMNQWWAEANRLITDTGNIILTSQFPFTLKLLNEATVPFRYDIIWNKRLVSGFLNAKRMPLRCHEIILVFYKKIGVYNPQFTNGTPLHSEGGRFSNLSTRTNRNYGKFKNLEDRRKGQTDKYPTTVLSIDRYHSSIMKHPTEKPIELAEWLVRSYSNEGQIVMDTCFGTGWTAVACNRLNRRFVGMEIDDRYYRIAKEILAQLVTEKCEWCGSRRQLIHTTYGIVCSECYCQVDLTDKPRPEIEECNICHRPFARGITVWRHENGKAHPDCVRRKMSKPNEPYDDTLEILEQEEVEKP